MIMSFFTLFGQKLIVNNRLSENTLNSLKSNSSFIMLSFKNSCIFWFRRVLTGFGGVFC